VADWLKSKGQVNAEEFWTFIWYNRAIKPLPIEQQERWHYFPDHEVVYWRSSWNDDATAFAFKAGSPEGHATTEKLKQFPDWRLSSGHAHPDAGSFIIWSKGKYLTGDSGYAGIPLTEHHNTVVFDGHGQAKERQGHDVFADVSYDRMNEIRINDLKVNDTGLSLIANLANAYEPELGVTRFTRRFEFIAPGDFKIEDDIAAAKERTVTSYLHADTSIVEKGNNILEFEPGKTSLIAQILEPNPAVVKIEKNMLITPGPPGNVDKGQREERGVRLAISTNKPAQVTKFILHLSIENQR
ncbi:MAG TPA: heparinase II/III family protein, partial [Pyrinomonadaceae bacterium]|nr:heparinase II/III family protein [Pyrinomonadaceae bacterium]